MYSEEKQYIDCISGISVSNVGHSNPFVKEAVKNQLDKHLHLMVYGELIQDAQTKLASRLSELLPDTLDTVYFVNSGSEAIEAAMKLAKRYTGRPRFLAQYNAYHGSTQGALSLMSDAYFSRAYTPLLPGIDFIHQNDVESVNRLIGYDTAAVFVEPVMGEKGYVPCDNIYLEALRKRCDETGTLLIFDEIQTGYGRSGELFAFQKYGVHPDILVCGKAFGGGLPLAAFISSGEILKVLRDKPVLGHITTFGGHPLSCAASYAALQFIIDGQYCLEASVKESQFRRLLKHEKIKSIDGCGLMLAIDLGDEIFCRRVIDYCVESGLLIDWFLYAAHKIRLAPPLIITENQIDIICGIIIENIDKAMQP